MARQNEFLNYLLELLAPFGQVTARKLFGGYGIYKEGLIFGIVIEDAFYLKVDDENRRDFTDRRLAPFVYESKSKGRLVSVGYFLCPEEALESPALMIDWARSGYAAALRAMAKKASKKAPPTMVKKPAKKADKKPPVAASTKSAGTKRTVNKFRAKA